MKGSIKKRLLFSGAGALLVAATSCMQGPDGNLNDQEMIATYQLLRYETKGNAYGTWKDADGTITEFSNTEWKTTVSNVTRTDKMIEYDRLEEKLYFQRSSSSPSNPDRYGRIRFYFPALDIAYRCMDVSGKATLDDAKNASAGEDFVDESTANCNGAVWTKMERQSK